MKDTDYDKLFESIEKDIQESLAEKDASKILKKLYKIDTEYEKNAERYLTSERVRQQKNAELSRVSFLG